MLYLSFLRGASAFSLYNQFAFAFPLADGQSTSHNFHPRDGPKWNPNDWPKSFTVNATQILGSSETECREFPDTQDGCDITATYAIGQNFDIFCWQNNWNRTFLRTKQDCYVFDEDINEDGNTDYTTLLPSCGSFRPAEVFAPKESYSLPPTDPHNIEMGYSEQNCWSCPSLSCTTARISWVRAHVYCYVNGTTVNGNNRWHEVAHRVNGDQRCYIPADAISKGPIAGVYDDTWAHDIALVDTEAACPDWDAPPAIL